MMKNEGETIMKISEKFKNKPIVWVVILAFGFALAGFLSVMSRPTIP